VFSFGVVIFIVMVFSAVPTQWLQGGWFRSYGVSLVITSLAASLASLPMTAFYFGRFSPIALLGNLAVVPLTFCIVLSGWLSVMIPSASSIFNHAALVFIDLMLHAVTLLDGLPGSSFAVERPPFPAVALWYGSLIYLFVHASGNRQRGFAVAGAGAAVLWAVLA
jgi:competence protein ComEC